MNNGPRPVQGCKMRRHSFAPLSRRHKAALSVVFLFGALATAVAEHSDAQRQGPTDAGLPASQKNPQKPGSGAIGAQYDADALNEMLAKERRLTLPCGDYTLDSALLIPDGGSIDGRGCVTFRMSASMAPNAILQAAIKGAVANFQTLIANASAAGNENIIVRNVTLDGEASPGIAHLAFFYKSTRIVFENVTCIGSGTATVQDCVAFVQSSDYQVRNNHCIAVYNACYDQWDGSHDFVISGNQVDGRGRTRYGVLVNGISTAYTPNVTSRGSISNNTIRGTKALGIGVYGLCTPEHVCGSVTDVLVAHNEIRDVSEYHGIWVGDASRVSVVDNKIKNIGANGIYVASQRTAGITRDVSLKHNEVIDANASRGTNSGVRVGNGSDTVINAEISDTIVQGHAHQYAIDLSKASYGARIVPGAMEPGILGGLHDAGEATQIEGGVASQRGPHTPGSTPRSPSR